TSAQKLTIGPAGGDSTGTILVLGTKTGSASDPTGVNGAMYYNATLAEFRCYADGVWTSCMANARTSYHYSNDFTATAQDGGGSGWGSGTNAGAGQSSGAAGEAGHPGILLFGAGSDTNGRAGYGTAGSDRVFLLGNGDYWRFETDLRVESTLSNST